MTGKARPIRLTTSERDSRFEAWLLIFGLPVAMVLIGADALDGGGLYEWFWLAVFAACWFWAIGMVRSGVWIDDRGAVFRPVFGEGRRVWWAEVEEVISRDDEDGRQSIHFLLVDGTEVATGIRRDKPSRTSIWWHGPRGGGPSDYAVALELIRMAHGSGTPPARPSIPRRRNGGRRVRRARR